MMAVKEAKMGIYYIIYPFGLPNEKMSALYYSGG
jgi:hypothetical protein